MQFVEPYTHEVVSKITTKGQITLPVEIRRLLGVDFGDQIAFVIKNEQVEVVPRGSVVARTAGALKSNNLFLSAKAMRKQAEQAIAQESVERMGS